MKVFEINDIEWWAGPDLKTTKDAYLTQTENDVEDTETMHELSDEEMESSEFFHEGNMPMSFKDRLKELVDKGESFPCFFASTEY